MIPKVPSYFSLVYSSIAITLSRSERDKKLPFFLSGIEAMKAKHSKSELGDSGKYALLHANLSWALQDKGEFKRALQVIDSYNELSTRKAVVNFSLMSIKVFCEAASMLSGEIDVNHDALNTLDRQVNSYCDQHPSSRARAAILGSLAMAYYAAYERGGYENDNFKILSKVLLNRAKDIDPEQLEKELLLKKPDIKEKLKNSRWFEFVVEIANKPAVSLHIKH